MENKKELIILTELDENVKEQLMNVYNHPKVVGKTIAFPDCHLGNGIPIGCLAILDNAISPNMVGSDIGCGVLTQQLKIKKDYYSDEKWKEIANKIREKVPMGFKWREQPHKSFNYNLLEKIISNYKSEFCKTHLNEMEFQVGTLGSGNHFIEFEYDEDNYVWITIHSGSRNIGKKVGVFYNKIAEKNLSISNKLKKQGLAYLEGDELENYWNDMEACMFFAQLNRAVIMTEIMSIIGDEKTSECVVNSIHNFAQKNGNLYYHRKGCIEMNGKQIIVGSQGTCSYIVEPTEFANEIENTCSHGAGRVLGRGEAKRTLSLEKELEILEKQHIIHSLRGKEQLDEATSAYKDIEKVIAQQKKYVKIIKKLKPFMVLKG